MPAINHLPIPELYVSADAASKLIEGARKLPGWILTPRQLCDLELLMNGGFYPLKGFMTQADYDSVMQDMRLSSGAVWPAPVTLDISNEFAAQNEPGDDIALIDEGECLAIMSVTDRWHHGGRVSLGGKVKGLRKPADAGDSPNQLRHYFAQQGWDVVTTAQTQGKASRAVLVLATVGLSNGTQKEQLISDGKKIAATYEHAVLATVNLAERSDRTQILRTLVARNYGATHVPDCGDAKMNRKLEAAGLTVFQAFQT